jgi:hypothetical protein
VDEHRFKIAGHDRAGGDHGPMSYSDPRKHQDACSEPGIVLNLDRRLDASEFR